MLIRLVEIMLDVRMAYKVSEPSLFIASFPGPLLQVHAKREEKDKDRESQVNIIT